MSRPRGGIIGICPQCRTMLVTEQNAEGRSYRRCPKCGWNDLETGGLNGTRGVEGPAATPAPAAAPARRVALLSIAIAVLGVVAAIVMSLLAAKK